MQKPHDAARLSGRSSFFSYPFLLSGVCTFCSFGMCGFPRCVCPEWEHLCLRHSTSGVQALTRKNWFDLVFGILVESQLGILQK